MLFRLFISFIGILLGPFRRLRTPPFKVRRVVYILWGGIGNAIMAAPAIMALHKEYRDNLFVYATHPCATEMLSPVKVVRAPALSLFGFLDTAKSMHRVHPDITITNFSSPSFLTSLLACISGAKYRVGYNRKARGVFFNVLLPDERTNEREANIKAVETVFSLTVDPRPTISTYLGFEENLLPWNDRKILGIHPGGGFKSWGVERYSNLIDSLKGMEVMLVGGAEDRTVINQIKTERKIYRYIGDNILKTADLVSRFSLFLSGDTGPMHIASAVGVPVIAIFGPTDPLKNRPYGDVKIMRKGLPCSPCYKYRRPLCRRRSCLDIPVREVLSVIERARIKDKG
ncbi:glycosyltransferase family 9 protein [candidate division WOR-3 bacterium]|nr:glycosyltransferase family 9 protein [candidate division WOR-3 bacterium]